jgi:hypothetical protein
MVNNSRIIYLIKKGFLKAKKDGISPLDSYLNPLVFIVYGAALYKFYSRQIPANLPIWLDAPHSNGLQPNTSLNVITNGFSGYMFTFRYK